MSLSMTLGGFPFHPQKAYAVTNSNINFQARLEGIGGSITPDGLYNVQFKLYSASSGGVALWTESYYDQNGATAGLDFRTQVTNGFVTVSLGSQTAFPTTIDWNQNLYLTMNVGGTTQTATPTYDGEMAPRLALTAVPYAFKAGQLAQFNATSGFTSTLSLLQPTVGNQTFQVADQAAAGTYNICIQGATTALGGCAASTGGAGYIQNQNAGAQSTSNFWISGTGRADTSITSPIFTGTGAVALNSAAATTLTVDSGTTGAINIGTSANAKTITVGNTTGATQLNLRAGTGNLYLSTNNINASIVAQSNTNSTTAFQVQDASSVAVLNVDTANTRVGIGTRLPTNTFAVSPLFYNTGTASQTTTTITGAGGATFTPSMVGQEFIFADGTKRTIVDYNSSTQLVADISGTVSSQAYEIHYTGLQVGSNGRVGIGTNAPTAALEVSSAVAGTPLFRVTDATTAGPKIVFGISDEGATTFQNRTDSATAFQIQNATAVPVLTVDTITSQTILTSANTDAVLGAATVDTAGGTNDFPTGWTATNWTTAANSATHTTGNSSALSSTWTPTSGTTYQVTYTYSACTAANTLGVTMGGQTLESTTSCVGTNTKVITATSTAALTFTPNSTYAGVISNVIIKALTTQVGSVLTVKNSSSVATLEVRSSGSTGNIFVGLNAGKNNTSSGTNNTALGTSALQSNTTGYQNTASGTQALQFNTTGIYNTASGAYALQNNTTGFSNTASGASALQANTTGFSNTASGASALQSNTTGAQNTASGASALQANTTGSNNTASGASALQANTTGFFNTALGASALQSNTTGSNNTASGTSALQASTTGSNNTASGTQALFSNTTGAQNTASGYQSLRNLKTLTGTISATVTNTGKAQFTSTSTTGLVAGLAITISGTTNYNGGRTIQSVDDATHFTITAAYSTADATGSWTSASSDSNTAEGYQAGIGSAVYTATGNSLFGYNSGFAIQSGANYNSLFGYSAGSGITTGTQNVLLGYNAGTNLTTGSNNVLIGQAVTAPSATGNNQLQIGTGISGDLSTGTLAVKTSTNSATAFQVQNAGGTAVLTVDTTNTLNLVTNGSFEPGTTGWALKTGSTISQVSSPAAFGQKSLLVATSASAQSGAKYNLTLASTTQYTFSLYATVAGANMSGTFDMGYAQDGSTETGSTVCTGKFVGTDGFYRLDCTFTTGTVSGTPYLFIKQNDATARNINIDGVMLEQNSTYSAYRDGKVYLSGVVAGPLLLQNDTNSATALEVKAVDRTTVFDVDTKTQRVGIGTSLPAAKLDVLTSDTIAVQVNQTNTSNQLLNLQSNGTSVATVSGTGAAVFKNTSATAFQVQNAAGNQILTVDTSGSTQVLLGKASSITGKLVVNNATNANTVTIVSGTTTSSYQLTLPTALGASGDCLKDTTGAGVLGFAACGASAVSLQATTPGAAQTGNFNITGVGIAGSLQAASLDTVSAGTLTLGGSTANAVSIGNASAATTVLGNLTAAKSLISISSYTNTTDGTKMQLQGTMTSAHTGQWAGFQNQMTFNPTGASIGNVYGLINLPTVSGSALAIGNLAGAYSRVDTSAGYTGQITNGYGFQSGPPSIAGSLKITNYMGFMADANTTNGGNTSGTINNYGLRVLANTTAAGALGTLNNYGVNIAMSTASGAGTTNNFGLVISGGTAAAGSYSLQNTSTALSAFSGNILQKTTNNSATALQIQNSTAVPVLTVDTSSQTLSVQAGTDTTTVGADLLATNNFTNISGKWGTYGTVNWTGSGLTATHLTGNSNTVTLTNTSVAITAGNVYLVSFNIGTGAACGSAAQTLSASLGGVTNFAVLTGDDCGGGTYSYVVTAINGNTLSFTPTASWGGTISAVTIQQITGAVNSALTVKNTSGTANLEVRTSSNVSNLFVGLGSGQYNSVAGGGVNNTAFGTNALESNTTGQTNTAVGTYSLLQNTSGTGNTAVGFSALASNTTGNNNVALGQDALYANTTGNNNSAYNYFALRYNTTGSENIGSGYFSLSNNTKGDGNTGVGTRSLQSNITGSNNTAIGWYAGYQDANGTFATSTGISGSTTIGAQAQVQANNTIVLGSVDTATQVVVGATVGVGTNLFGVSPIEAGLTGTASQSGTTTITGSGANGWTTAMVGDKFIWADGNSGTIASVPSASSLTLVSGSFTETTQAYRIHHIGFQVTNAGNAYVQNSSTTALQVLNSAGTTILNVDTSTAKVTVNADVSIGKRADSGGTTSDWATASGAAGTPCASGATAVDKITSSVVFNGSLYIGTSEQDKAELCRYDGGTTYTRINSAAGSFAASPSINVDTIGAMTVWNGQLYIGTTGGAATTGADTGKASVYRWDGSTTFTLVNTTQGTFDTITTAIDGVSSMVVHQGTLLIGTTEPLKAEVYEYKHASTPQAAAFISRSGTAGSFGTRTAFNTVSTMVVNDNQLYIGCNKTNGAEAFWWNSGLGASGWYGMNPPGKVTGQAGTSDDEINAMAVFNGNLYIASSETGTGGDVRMGVMSGNTAVANDAFSMFNALYNSGTGGTIGGTGSIDKVTAITVYNGNMYVGTQKSNAAEVYRYDGGEFDTTRFTKVSQTTAGTIKSSGTTAIDGISTMIAFNDLLFVGTNETGNGTESYTFSAVEGQSQRLMFNASSDNAGSTEQASFPNQGSIYFAAEQNATTNPQGGATGSFIFSAGILTNSGAYDVAEDYPTRDDSLKAGDLVSIDPNETGFVRKASGAYDSGLVGVFSAKPALRLTQKDATINGGRAVPIALAGRVPVQVSTENGVIMPGDPLTSSSVPGVAMKATGVGRIVGMAMESFNGTDTGTITVFVNPSYYSGADNAMLLANALQSGGDGLLTNLQVNGQLGVGNLNVSGATSLHDLTVTGSVTVTNDLTVAGVVSVGSLVVNGHIVTTGEVPTIAVGVAAGTSTIDQPAPVASVDGNDTAGTVSVTTGKTVTSKGVLSEVTFAQAFANSKFKVSLTPTNDNALDIRAYIEKTATGFRIVTKDTAVPTTQYDFDYIIIGVQAIH